MKEREARESGLWGGCARASLSDQVSDIQPESTLRPSTRTRSASSGDWRTVFDDVRGRWPRRIDKPAPAPAWNEGHFEIKSVPVHVEDRMRVGRASEAGPRVRQATGVGIIPARLVQVSPVPGDVRQPTLVHLAPEVTRTAAILLTCGDEEHPEAQERPVLFRQAPVEPADLIVLAVGVVVASLGPPAITSNARW
jgi:hypothetical protein